MKNKYIISDLSKDDVIRVSCQNIIDEVVQQSSEWVVDTTNIIMIKNLIKLGWIPPKNNIKATFLYEDYTKGE